MSTRTKGNYFETIASIYLQHKGYTVIDAHKSFTSGEIDLVCKHDDFIIFIEVKSLEAHSPFYIYEMLTKTKKKRLRSAIFSWLKQKNLYSAFWRLDFIGIINSNDIFNIEHFENIEV